VSMNLKGKEAAAGAVRGVLGPIGYISYFRVASDWTSRIFGYPSAFGVMMGVLAYAGSSRPRSPLHLIKLSVKGFGGPAVPLPVLQNMKITAVSQKAVDKAFEFVCGMQMRDANLP